MPSWSEVLDEIHASSNTHDLIRRKYLTELFNLTKRNTIVYYSGWLEKSHLQRQGITGFEVNDSDKNGLMATIHNMDRSLGLDLILHTPGGETAATESIVDYLRAMFGTNIRAIVPQLALSAGTMISLACEQIVMGKHSSLGPIDPQIFGMPAHGIMEEFERARKEVTEDPSTIPLWQPIIAKYTPTLVGECQKAIDWSEEMVKDWLVTGMLRNRPDSEADAQKVIEDLGDHALTKSHARHISLEKAANEIGLEAVSLEDDQDLQEAVLTVHHACIHTLAATNTVKIIENHMGVAHINSVNVQR